VALLVIAAGVLIACGPAAGAVSLLLPALAWAWGMGILAALFSPLNLFHLLGGFLGFCVALDYGLFFHHARATGRGLPLSIRVSAATTLSAFGVLAFGSIPAVAALGSSVFAVVLGGLIMVEMAAFFPSKNRLP
jgi:predicted exporter